MTVKCTFCNDTKVEPGIPGPCVWCEEIAAAPSAPVVQRFSAVALRFATTTAKDYVSGDDFDSVTAERDSLSAELEQCQARRRQFVDEVNARTTVLDEQADAAQTELAALREELARINGISDNYYSLLVDANQSLTSAEQRNVGLVKLLQRVVDSSVLSFEQDAPEELESLEADICAALSKQSAMGGIVTGETILRWMDEHAAAVISGWQLDSYDRKIEGGDPESVSELSNHDVAQLISAVRTLQARYLISAAALKPTESGASE